MFKDQIRTTMEVYVDEMLVKSTEEDHLKNLEQAFGIMRAYGIKLNPSKCTFGVRGGKFLGYMVSEKGIEANPEKIEAIAGLRSPKMLKEVQKLTGKVASLSRFISRSADRSLLFFKSLGKVKEFKWTEECEQALQSLKRYLATPPLLANPKVGHLMTRPDASGRLVKWAVELGEYNIEYKGRTVLKAQVLEDFIVEFTREQIQEESKGLLLHVDGSSNASNGGAGILLQGPNGSKSRWRQGCRSRLLIMNLNMRL
ncbi:UNVERIFIED_CONTAM: hypothetical protein Slati_3416800 [Sesamum latifolium]|uniref:Reverse transcriptase domain-containing protein n=1 Tax=Sesamum latifolium TaxID=2727402 RepID=A0AAW2UFW5_9LAMI